MPLDQSRAAGRPGVAAKLLAFFAAADPPAADIADVAGEEPIRAELFSVERLEELARTLAAAQQVTLQPALTRRLEPRLSDNQRVLRAAYLSTVALVHEQRDITPATDWLVNNFTVVEEQVREIRKDLPPGYYRRLPKLAGGPHAGYPRVFGLAWAFVAHTDSCFDVATLRRFLDAYQQVQPLTIGELWAVAITLRVVLVENLRRLAVGIAQFQAARHQADVVADRLLGVGGRVAETPEIVLEPIVGVLPLAFAVQLLQRLREQDPLVLPAQAWLTRRLGAQGMAADAIVHDEQLGHGAVNVTIRNVITSMRLMSAIDWRTLVESVSLIDRTLSADSAFAEMDFPTRDLYRHAIETLARGSTHQEIDIARLALAAVTAVPQTASADRAADARSAAEARRQDPGYALLAQGRPAFETRLGFHPGFKARLMRSSAPVRVILYATVMALLTAAILSLPLLWGGAGSGFWAFWLLPLLALIPASDAAMSLVNCGATRRLDATPLPGMALADGVPVEHRTLVVMPVLLTTVAAVVAQIERLEIHHLGNDDGDLTFVLLSDWTDSDSESAPEDEALLDAARQGIAALNQRTPAGAGGERFLLLHRRRLWNPQQGQWIGWERKRGKLHELNRLLRGATDTSFIAVGGRPPSVPAATRYVIVLDSDTWLPRGVAKRLVGKMAHPLNCPVLAPSGQQVVEGYAVLQPRITPYLPNGSEGSLFQRIFSSATGMDPYACAVSDVYQDLFGEGSYCGKGIYHVDAFEAALADRIPDNTLLSHDLFEGIFARAGLVSDIEVIDEFPQRYDIAVARQSRWVRGDWQLLPWIVGWPMTKAGRRPSSGIPLIGRWKMFDNLRRSLSAPTSFLALLAGWCLTPASAGPWTLFILLILSVPALIPLIAALPLRQAGLSLRLHFHAIGRDAGLAFWQALLLVTFLTHQGWVMTDAILRTLFRLLISRRKLLQWVTAAQAKLAPRLTLSGTYRQMAGATLLAAATTVAIVLAAPDSWPYATPLVMLWLLSPVAARWTSLPSAANPPSRLGVAGKNRLRMAARRTWCFFETFVTASDNWLPPDNFQEQPVGVLAHRTSPTNLGLYLLSVAAAHDFGWIGATAMVTRLEATLTSMGQLERCRGHFYNWYDTSDRRPLEPKYISSVDSGNLAGHLICLWNACREVSTAPIVDPAWRDGIADAAALLKEVWRQHGDAARPRLDSALKALDALLAEPATTPSAIAASLAALLSQAREIVDCVRALQEAAGKDAGFVELAYWADAIKSTVQSRQIDLTDLLPWATLTLPAPPGLPDKAASPLRSLLEAMPSLAELPQLCRDAAALLGRCRAGDGATAASSPNDGRGSESMLAALRRSEQAAAALQTRLTQIIAVSRAMVEAMAFDFLFNAERGLLSIGYRVVEGALDTNYYDLLASEARLASFVAIAKGSVPTRHWFRLGRTLVPVGYSAALISWSGSMFEYLMPGLVMRAPAGSLLEQTNRGMVRRQIAYGRARGVPWGASESAFNARDLEMTYRYSSFGIPDLALKPGIADDTVIAPYATGLAAMVDDAAALDNFERLQDLGGIGRYGFYEALDYTTSRLPEGLPFAIVRCFMAHHQAMSIVGIANALQDGAMRRRFHAEPMIQATELLLQECMPDNVAIMPARLETLGGATSAEASLSATERVFRSPHARNPRTHLLCNGSYAVMLTAAGSGYSRWRDLAVTRWREDATCDNWGSYIFLHDLTNRRSWSAGYQPSGMEPDHYEATFSEGRAEFCRHDGTIRTHLEVAVSSEDDAEVRRVSITNLGPLPCEIEVTSFAELVLAPATDDDAHPAFSKMFVETEWLAAGAVLLAHRRQQSAAEADPWAAHLAVVEGDIVGAVQFESDRARFLGRGREVGDAAALDEGVKLSSTAGVVLDAIFTLRYKIRIPPGTTARVAFWTVITPSRQGTLDLADRHRAATAFDRATTLAWTQAQVQLLHMGLSAGQANLFQRLASHILYLTPTLRPASDVLERGGAPLSLLWRHGISGDRPIVLLRVDDEDTIEIVHQMLLAQEYWRMKRLAVDLVLLNDKPASYAQGLQSSLETLVRLSGAQQKSGAGTSGGSVFLLRSDLISADESALLLSVARVVLHGRRGSLADQVDAAADPIRRPAPIGRIPPHAAAPAGDLPVLEFFNGSGGFAELGRAYFIALEPGQHTPMPWINVVCNREFGFQISADGGGFCWSLDSQQNQITPWSNDPVGDPPGDVLYIKDEDSGQLWTPTALPMRDANARYQVRHGQGYSRFLHRSHDIALELLLFVPIDDPVKISRLTISDLSGRQRRLSVTAYVAWVLGAQRAVCAAQTITEIDPATGAMLARNPFNAEFGQRVAFADLGGHQDSWTGDRTEFIGRLGSLASPQALTRHSPLSNLVGAGLDPCGALQTHVSLVAHGSHDVVFLLGQGSDRAAAGALLRKYRDIDIDLALAGACAAWDKVLGTVQVTTPDRSMDILLNGWLLYQTLACRLWSRAAFYQASGAYGFRDQLQDSMALCVVAPDESRAHLLRAAARQFAEGDVQHWWLPESGRGIRTRITDDRVWLAFVAAHYVAVSGDLGVLDVMVPFLEGPPLRDGERESFFLPIQSVHSASLYDHCALALDASLGSGAHGLPLIGTGDWNDGMNRVGEGGKGESVWLGWFLHLTLSRFSDLAQQRGDAARAAHWRAHAAKLAPALEGEGWDGAWYRRAFFDDGTAIGSAADSECRIDSIAQSWAVLSGAAAPDHAQRAMAAVERLLMRPDDGLALLFTPPFDRSSHNPGYIKAYPPGLRENGGQYTHAALWSVMALTMLGDGDKAVALFSMLNPINHALSPDAVQRYQVEPYVVCADLYSTPPHVGRGGWSWYTGSAGWMYRAGLESILGIRQQGTILQIDPCIPRTWPGFSLKFRYRTAIYDISVENPRGVSRGVTYTECDGAALAGDLTVHQLQDDGQVHSVKVVLG